MKPASELVGNSECKLWPAAAADVSDVPGQWPTGALHFFFRSILSLGPRHLIDNVSERHDGLANALHVYALSQICLRVYALSKLCHLAGPESAPKAPTAIGLAPHQHLL
jgi:hypothetical protein